MAGGSARRWWQIGGSLAALGVAGLALLLLTLPEVKQPEEPSIHSVHLVVPPEDPMAPTPLGLLPDTPEPPAPLGLVLPEVDPNAQPWLRHAVPMPPAEGRPRIAVVIDDLGLNRPAARRTIALPGPLTLSFMTYAEGLAEFGAAGRAAGHELMLHVPMEPDDPGLDPGPRALRLAQDSAAIVQNLEWGLDRMSGYVGINNHMGSRFTAEAEAMRPVLAALRARGLLFLDSRTAPRSAAQSLAAELGVPTAGRDVFLDHETSEDFIRQQLAQTEAIARRQGSAIAIGHPYPETLELLAEWLPSLAEKGFQLAPVSAVVRDREAVRRQPVAASEPGEG